MGAGPLKGLRALEPEKKQLASAKTRDQCVQSAPYLENLKGGKTPNTASSATTGMSELEAWCRTQNQRECFSSREIPVSLQSKSVRTSTTATSTASQQLVHCSTASSQPVMLAEQIVGIYHIEGVLGHGKYSHVLHIQSKTTTEEYALKVVRKLTKILEDSDGYQVEIGILSQFSHPNIVALHGVFHTRSKAYLFLELAAGGDLFDRISAQGHFSESLGRSTLKMILDGLAYLHDNGITHRDLKLENILYKNKDVDSKILLADFGLAHVASERHGYEDANMSATCGTPDYMSPEMLEGEEYCEKVDVWAVGVVLFVVLSGKMPFVEGVEGGGKGRAKLYQDIRSGQYSFDDKVWCEVSSLAQGFIRQLLSVDVASRFSARQALNHPWTQGNTLA